MSKAKDAPAITDGTEDSKQSTALAIPEDLAKRFAEDAGAGLEDFTGGDFKIPFLVVLQKGSPQVDESDGKYVTGAKPGMVYNTVTNEIYDCLVLQNRPEPKGINVAVAAYNRAFVEWVEREQGGGFVAQHLADSPAHRSAHPDKDKPTKLVLPNGNRLEETMYYYVTLDAPGKPWGVIAMKSTQLKQAKSWNTQRSALSLLIDDREVPVPVYGQCYKLQTVPEDNVYGSWFGWRITFQGVLMLRGPETLASDTALYDKAKGLREAVRGGKVRATAPPVDENEDAGQGAQTTAEVPF